MKTKGRPQSKNIQDVRRPIVANSYESRISPLREGRQFEVSAAQRKNARALGMSDQLSTLQNDANRLEARMRRRDSLENRLKRRSSGTQ